MLHSRKKAKFDFITLGRAGFDLYAHEENVSLPKVNNFLAGVGGTPANVAVGLAALKSKVAIITKVSEDGIGDFIVSYLKKKKVNTDFIVRDKKLKTSLALTEIKPKNGSVVFYRENPCDLNLRANEIDYDSLKKSESLIISGTNLARDPSRTTTIKVADFAQKNDVNVIFDLDYRAYHWKNKKETTLYYDKVARQSDIIIGNTEEFKFLIKNITWQKAKKKLFDKWLTNKAKIIILKNGPLGTKIYTKDKKEVFIKPFNVKSKKPFGAGDAFLAGFCYAWKKKRDLTFAGNFASASAAIVVSKKTCSEAMPSEKEILHFIQNNPK